MELWKLFVLGIVIGSNNLAVAFALGSLNIRSYWWRIILTFGLFEFFIPLVGIFIGREFSKYIADYASYIGGSLLLLIGILIIYSALSKDDNHESKLLSKITSWTGIISISAGMSLDNLVVGFSIGLQEIHPLTSASVIATSSIVFTLFGLNVGKYLKKKFRVWTEIGAATLLLLIGFATLMEWI
tara:strand:- start:24064 stop:24618 length:555 start_codon:yes stop_codon:yes gene_type:complete